MVIIARVHDKTVLGPVTSVTDLTPKLFGLGIMQIFNVPPQRDLVPEDFPTYLTHLSELASLVRPPTCIRENNHNSVDCIKEKKLTKLKSQLKKSSFSLINVVARVFRARVGGCV
jgi:hypothetical protein